MPDSYGKRIMQWTSTRVILATDLYNKKNQPGRPGFLSYRPYARGGPAPMSIRT
jgi:hypothetical protein